MQLMRQVRQTLSTNRRAAQLSSAAVSEGVDANAGWTGLYRPSNADRAASCRRVLLAVPFYDDRRQSVGSTLLSH